MADDNHFVLFYADEDEETAEAIHENLIKLGLKGCLSSDVVPGKSEMCGPLELAEKSSIVFFLVTDNLASDKKALVHKDDTIMRTLLDTNTTSLVIPLFLEDKKHLKQRNNVAFAGLMSKSGINVKSRFFEKKIGDLKQFLGLPTGSTNIHNGSGDQVKLSEESNKAGNATGFGGVNTNDVKVEIKDTTQSSETGSMSSDVQMEHGSASAGVDPRNSGAGSVPIEPPLVLQLMQIFHTIEIVDVRQFLDKMIQHGVLNDGDRDSYSSCAAGEIKTCLLSRLMDISGQLTGEHLQRLLEAFQSCMQPCNNEENHRLALLYLRSLLQLKIQNCGGLLDGLWSGSIILTSEREQCKYLLDGTGSNVAFQRLVQFMLAKNEKMIEEFFQILALHVSPGCRDHMDHAVKAFKEGQVLPDCCAKFRKMSPDQIDDVISGPFQKSLKKHLMEVRDNIDLNSIIDPLWSKKVLTLDQYERINSVPTTTKKASLLVHEIYKHDEEQVVMFVDVLKSSTGSNPTLASLIEKTAKSLNQTE